MSGGLLRLSKEAIVKRTVLQKFALLASVLIAACAGFPNRASQVDAVDAVDLQKGFALKGYDPVAYFADGRPTAGDTRISYRWHGATWLFSTSEHRAAFALDPARYAPQFGGYCAFAVSRGTTADGDPFRWAVVGDKLYLNNNALAMKFWDEDRPGNIQAGNSNWELIPKKPVVEGGQSPSTDDHAPAAGEK